MLGICLGMQLLFAGSEEGDIAVPRPHARRASPRFRRTRRACPCRTWAGTSSTCASRLAADARHSTRTTYVYFVHSYAAPPVTVDASRRPTTAAILGRSCGTRNFLGAQFHPERSVAAGARLLANFS